MKKVYIILGTILLLWIVYMGVEYFRCYKPDTTDNKPLITIKTEDEETYTKDVGLGFSVVRYKVSLNDAPDGTVIKEFRILGISFSETSLVREK